MGWKLKTPMHFLQPPSRVPQSSATRSLWPTDDLILVHPYKGSSSAVGATVQRSPHCSFSVMAMWHSPSTATVAWPIVASSSMQHLHRCRNPSLVPHRFGNRFHDLYKYPLLLKLTTASAHQWPGSYCLTLEPLPTIVAAHNRAIAHQQSQRP